MNVDYVRQVAAECDDIVKRATRPLNHGGIDYPIQHEFTTALIRAAAVLHTAVLPPESQEAPNDDEMPTGEDFLRTYSTPELLSEAEPSPFRGFEQYDELARAACAAAGIVWPATHSGLLHAIQGIADENSAWHDSWRSARTERDKTRAELDRLRRELWHVLDRMPSSDDDLIASVKKLRDDSQRCGPHPIEIENLRRERDHSIRQHEKTADAMEAARTERDEFRESWHSTVNQRDALVRAAREHINGWCGRSTKDLTAAIKKADAPSNWEKP